MSPGGDNYFEDEPWADEWVEELDEFRNNLLGDETPPTAPAEFKVIGREKAVHGEFRPVNVVGVTGYSVYRSTTKNFDLSSSTELLVAIAQVPDPETDIVSFQDPDGDDESYYFVRALKGNQNPTLKGVIAGPANTLDGKEILLAPGKVTGVGLTINEIENAQNDRLSSCSFTYTEPDPVGNFQFCEIWITGYQAGYRPVLFAQSSDQPFISILNITEETIAFQYVAANLQTRRKRVIVSGSYAGSDNVTTALNDPNGKFKELKVTTDDLVVNTGHGGLFSITSIDEETKLTIAYIANTPLSTSEGDFDDGDGYLILQGPYKTGLLHSVNNDTDVPDPTTDVSVDIDIISVDPVSLTNEILVGAQAVLQADTAFEVNIQAQPPGAAAYNAAAGFSGTPTIDKTGPHPFVFSKQVSALTDLHFIARVKNHFGWGNFTAEAAHLFQPSLDPTDSEDDIPTLDEFGVWTLDQPHPTAPSQHLTGLSVQLTFKLGDDNQTTFMISLQGSESQTFPDEVVVASQLNGTATVERGALTVAFSGFSTGFATLNEFAGKVLYMGKRNSAPGGDVGFKNVDESLSVFEIVSNTANPSGATWSAVLKGVGSKGTINDGALTNWSIVTTPIWQLVDYYKDVIIDTSGSQWTNFNAINVEDRNFSIDLTVNGMYFRAAPLNVHGQGTYRYSL